MGIMGRNGSTEMSVTVDKTNLIKILMKNREEHLKLFKEAHKAWRGKTAEAYGEAAVNAARAAKEWSAYFEGEREKPKSIYLGDANNLREPASHVAEYDRALGMLTLHTGETMTLDMDSYRRYVDDEWDWSNQAKAIFDSYTVQRGG